MTAKLAALLFAVGILIGPGRAAVAQPTGETPSRPQAPPSAWRKEASLRDIFFINHDLGWAVGDQGTILRTEDGGRSWNLVAVNSSCSLRSVQFVDEENGWAMGGQAVPMVGRTNAVILKTSDGGRTWKEMDGTLLPSVRGMQMANHRSGWAWGAPTQNFPSGIFSTEDAGYSWSNFPIKDPAPWRAVAKAGDGFVAITDQGLLGTLDGKRFHPANALGNNSEFRRVVFFDSEHGWAIGDRALASSDDAGKTWRNVTLPQELADLPRFELTTAGSGGGKCWLAGSPGTYLFAYDLKSQQWSRARTPIRSAIHKLFFFDQQHGWAVGDGGQISVTRDGGETWQVQRSPPSRIALLVVCASADCIPFDLLARYSADQGYLTAVFLNRADSVYGDGPQRAFEACQRQGVSIFVQSRPVSVVDEITQLVGVVRQWQPTAIVVADALPKHDRPFQKSAAGARGGQEPSDLSSSVMAAVSRAADPAMDREWINQTALPPWQTPFVYQTQPREGDSVWGSPEFLPELGRNTVDQQLVSRALVLHPGDFPDGVELIGLGNRAPTSDLFAGLSQGSLAPPRRTEQPLRGHLGQIKSINNKAAVLNQLLSQFDSSSASLKVWQERIDRLCADLPAETAGSWLWQLSEAYWRADQLELAALARAALLQRCVDHPLAPESRLWLATYYASPELSWYEFSQRRRRAEARGDSPEPAVQQTGLRSSPQKSEVDGVTRYIWTIEPPEHSRQPTDPRAEIQGQLPPDASDHFEPFIAERTAIAAKLIRSIQQRDPEMMAAPQMSFAECLLQCRTEGPGAAESSLRRLSTQSLPADQRQNIAREIRLMGGSAWASLPDSIECPRAESRPYLDGVLDDDIWRSIAQSNQIAQLKPVLGPNASAAANPQVRDAADPSLGQTQVMLAHDEEYLYVAVVCHRVAPAGSPRNGPPARRRERDRPLIDPDQLHVAIDVDRDGKMFYWFAVDAQGSFVDRLGDDWQWNPTWYLAQAGSELNWIIEAAIPLDDLGPPPSDSPDSAWGISLRRARPDGLVERWSPVRSPEEDASWETRPSQLDFRPPDGVIRFR